MNHNCNNDKTRSTCIQTDVNQQTAHDFICLAFAQLLYRVESERICGAKQNHDFVDLLCVRKGVMNIGVWMHNGGMEASECIRMHDGCI